MDDFESQSVELHIYDMTQGMASMMSPILLGKLTSFPKASLIFQSISRQVDKSMVFGIQLWLFSVVNISLAPKVSHLVHQ